ncbi:MAG: hypothetical protein NE330_12570 [Lentisphaeraceae bacterium]|nr:hypothetical protein [Lentisphaeraceae bacterium]
MLDNCLVLHGSATGKSHDPHNYPLILAGGKNMGHNTGQFIKYDEQKNAISNLFARMGNAAATPIESFGDSSGIQMSELFN